MHQKSEKQKAQEILEQFVLNSPEISAIYEGISPEEESKTYYLLINTRYNESLADRISDIDFNIANNTNHECNVMEWPCPPEEISDYPFLGKRIWTRTPN